jgi:hypothetical protein
MWSRYRLAVVRKLAGSQLRARHVRVNQRARNSRRPPPVDIGQIPGSYQRRAPVIPPALHTNQVAVVKLVRGGLAGAASSVRVTAARGYHRHEFSKPRDATPVHPVEGGVFGETFGNGSTLRRSAGRRPASSLATGGSQCSIEVTTCSSGPFGQITGTDGGGSYRERQVRMGLRFTFWGSPQLRARQVVFDDSAREPHWTAEESVHESHAVPSNGGCESRTCCQQCAPRGQA